MNATYCDGKNVSLWWWYVQGGQFDARYVLLYYYYGGMVYACLHKYLRALLFLTVVCSHDNFVKSLWCDKE